MSVEPRAALAGRHPMAPMAEGLREQVREQVVRSDARNMASLERMQRERQAMRQAIERQGFGHALDSVVQGFVTEMVPDGAHEQKWTTTAKVTEAVVLDALVGLGKRLGWAVMT